METAIRLLSTRTMIGPFLNTHFPPIRINPQRRHARAESPLGATGPGPREIAGCGSRRCARARGRPRPAIFAREHRPAGVCLPCGRGGRNPKWGSKAPWQARARVGAGFPWPPPDGLGPGGVAGGCTPGNCAASIGSGLANLMHCIRACRLTGHSLLEHCCDSVVVI